MKKVVFLIGMMVGLNGVCQFNHFDNVPFLKDTKLAEPMVMFREYGNDSTVNVYGTISEITEYALEFTSWAGYDYENPFQHENKNGKETRTYVIEYEEGSSLVTFVIFRERDNYAELSSCIINRVR
jgi:hypothetical protein